MVTPVRLPSGCPRFCLAPTKKGPIEESGSRTTDRSASQNGGSGDGGGDGGDGGGGAGGGGGDGGGVISLE